MIKKKYGNQMIATRSAGSRFKLSYLYGWFAFAAIFFAINYRFYLSQTIGRSGAEPSYDDIVYLLDAQDRLRATEQMTTWGTILSWIDNPPHSPISTFIALVTQLFFGNSASAVYYINSFVISLIVYLIFREFINSKTYSVYLTAIFVGSPLGPMLMFNFRPDPLYALVMTLFIFKISKYEPKSSLRSLILFPSILLLIKPSFIFFTFIATFYFFIANFTLYRKSKIKISKLLIDMLLSLGISGWYLVNGLSEIIYYVRSNTSGKTKSLWTEHGFVDAIVTNIRAVGLQIGPKFSLILLLSCVIICFVRWRQAVRDRTVISLVSIGMINLFISVYTQISNPFFYLTSILPLLFLCLLLLITTNSSPKKYSMGINLLASIGLLISMLLLPSQEWAAKEIRLEGPVNQEFADFLKAEKITHVYFLFAGGLNSDTTRWYLEEAGENISFDNFGLVIFNKDQAIRSVKEIGLKNSVIVTRSENINGFPSDGVQEDINSYFKANSILLKIRSKELGNYSIWLLKN